MKKIFFAIPCGDFYAIQNEIIDAICKKHSINKVVIEEKSKTDFLWQDIVNEIDSSDMFVCDISSESPNIAIELGYAFKEKSKGNIAIFISKNKEVFSDIKGIKYKEYRSYLEFKELLEKWINEQLYTDTSNYKTIPIKISNFHEEFKDLNKFIRLWDTPPGCQYNLEFDGFHYTNCHMPIMSNHLALLKNYLFDFRTKILSRAVGWVIKGTKKHNDITPQFCLMFNIAREGELMPHIFNRNNIDPINHYHRLEKLAANIGTTIDPNEKELYNFRQKDGQVGFRCHPDEEAIIMDVNIEIK